jgi:hypothetical protein
MPAMIEMQTAKNWNQGKAATMKLVAHPPAAVQAQILATVMS